MTKPRRPILAFLKAYPFSLLLGSLIIMIIGAPYAGKMAKILPVVGSQGAIAPFVLLVTLGATFALWPAVKSRVSTIVLGGVVVALLYFSTFFNLHIITLIHLVAQTLFLFYVIAIVTRVVFRAPIVDGNILCGAACLYLLAGVFFGFVYCLIEWSVNNSFAVTPLDPGSPVAKSAALGASGIDDTLTVNPGWLIYFSFTTLTTVGLGDILPTTETSRSFSALEAIIGQIMVVVMMARLVGLHVAQITSGSHKKDQATVFAVSNENPPGASKGKEVGE